MIMTGRQQQQQQQQPSRQHEDAHHHDRRLIVGGHNIERGRYPYFVSINKNNGVIVNGVLIAPDIVLSAGHIALNHMDNLTLKVGPYAVHDDTESFMEEIPVTDNWLVPMNWTQFEIGFFDEDYLILKLEYPSRHKPITINRNPTIPKSGQHVIMAGLGWLNESYVSPANIVQEVELVTIDNSYCESIVDPYRNMTYHGKIKESMLCTISPPNTTRDGCAWDSGAPVIIAGDTPEEDLLVALGSTGVGCADKVFPAIQARVGTGFSVAWIREQVCRLSIDPPEDFHCPPPILPPPPVNNSNNNNMTNLSSALEEGTASIVVSLPSNDFQMPSSTTSRHDMATSTSTPPLAALVVLSLAVVPVVLGIIDRINQRNVSRRRQVAIQHVERSTFRIQERESIYGSMEC